MSETVREFKEQASELRGLVQEYRRYFAPAEFEHSVLRDLLIALGSKVPARWRQQSVTPDRESELHIELLGRMGRLRRLIVERRGELRGRVKVDLSALKRALVSAISTSSEAADVSADIIAKAVARLTEGFICDMVNAGGTLKRETINGVPCVVFHPPADKTKKLLEELAKGGAA